MYKNILKKWAYKILEEDLKLQQSNYETRIKELKKRYIYAFNEFCKKPVVVISKERVYDTKFSLIRLTAKFQAPPVLDCETIGVASTTDEAVFQCPITKNHSLNTLLDNLVCEFRKRIVVKMADSCNKGELNL